MTSRTARPDDRHAAATPTLPTARGQGPAARTRFATACRASAVVLDLAGDPAGAQQLRETAAGAVNDEGEPTDGRP